MTAAEQGPHFSGFSWASPRCCLVTKILHHWELKAPTSQFVIFLYIVLKSLWSSALSLKSNPVRTILLGNCTFFLRIPSPVALWCTHFCRDLVSKADFLRPCYSFAILWRTYNSKPHVITFSIKKLSQLYDLGVLHPLSTAVMKSFGWVGQDFVFISYRVVATLILGLCSVTYREVCLLHWKAGFDRRIRSCKSFQWSEFPPLNCFLHEESVSKVINV